MNAAERTQMIAQRKEPVGRPVRLWCKDEWREFAVYRVPVDALLLNVENHRFTAERKLAEAKLGHPLDPENSEQDQLSIICILCDDNPEVQGETLVGKPSKDYEALKADWERRKQATPFWIRPDGTVRNGNRRLAMLKRMRSKTLTGTEWADAIILDPDDVEDGDVFEMEQREQLTEDFKKRYTDINALLTIRAAAIARKIDWYDQDSIKAVAGQLQQIAGGDENYAAIQLQTIKYMDIYLEDAGAPGQYAKLIRQVERFRDIGKSMVKMEADYPDDVPDMLKLLFAAVKGENTNDDIRAIFRIFLRDRSRYNRLKTRIEKEEETWVRQGQATIADPEIGVGDDQDDPEDPAVQVTPGPVTPGYPKEAVREGIKLAIDGFEADTLDVMAVLEQIDSRVQTLAGKSERVKQALQGAKGEAAKAAVARINAWAKAVERY